MFEDKAQKSVDIGMMDPLGLERDLKNEPGLLHSYGSKTWKTRTKAYIDVVWTSNMHRPKTSKSIFKS